MSKHDDKTDKKNPKDKEKAPSAITGSTYADGHPLHEIQYLEAKLILKRQGYRYLPITDWLFSYNREWLRGSDRRPDCGRCGHSQGDGLCNDRGTSSASRTLHRVCADDHLRGAWNISASQREYNHNDCDSHRK